ncbi:PAS domain S-box-containing protein [Flavobacterium gillisiae]|uniref:histidine kinase n=1 Tax=Flavobacterium gillisiae TaxID=150146 RepID=A0A1H4G2M4_9FLAO|nr:PAS domain S-box protein [Flavobacterium gillisiae]SEB03561.1 PAS domain S-box-containing protein [Flavobacterium gillisiae]
MKSENNRLKFYSLFLTKPRATGFFTFLLLSIIVGFIGFQQFKIVKDDEHRAMRSKLQVINQNIEQSLKNSYTSTLTLALTINDQGVPENFDSIGKKLVASNQTISAVQLVPNGVIRFTYPAKGNEAAMGLNILKSAYLREEALKSIQSQKMYFAGPINLKQGGVGIVGRLPVFQNDKFWGFSAVIIKLEDLLKSSGAYNIDRSKYYFQFSKVDPTTQKEVFYLPKENEFSKNYSVSIGIPDGDWEIHLTAKHQNYLYSQIVVPAIFGLLLAALFAFLVTMMLKKPAELQLLVEKQAANLIKSEIKFKSIFDQAAVGIVYVDSLSGYFLEINEQYSKLLGYSAQELQKKTFQSVTYPDDLNEDLSNLEKLKQGTIREYAMEKRYITKSGKIIWTNITVSPLWNIDEKPSKHIAIVEDISLKKEAEQLIKKTENHFKSLFEDSPLPLREEDFSKVKSYLKELNLMNLKKETVEHYLLSNPKETNKLHSLIKLVNVNKACLKLYKVNSKEELLKVKSELFNRSSYEGFTKQLIAITQNHEKVVLDTIIKNSKEELRFINLRWNVIRGYETSLDRIIVSNEDITERKTAEKIIIDSQTRTESLINTIDGIVWECDIENFSFSFISKKVENILGYTDEEWLASPTFWADHIYHEDQESVINYCVLKTSQNLNHDFEYRMIAKNGSVIWLRDIVTIVFKNDKPSGLRGIMIDITKNKEAEKDLKNSFNLVTEQNKRLLNFSYIVSHNLRSHTSNISSIMSLIETSESEEEKNEMLLLLKSVSNSLNETMLHLNEVINIRNNIGLVSESLNLKNYLEATQNVLSEQIIAKQVTIMTNVPSDVMVNYNPAYLESILHNIISNSIRYSHPDREPLIGIKWLIEDEMNVLQISDNGIGIDLVKNADKIFGMYKTFSNNPESKGIGLFITKNQIDAMNGNITVESKLNIGTIFKIYIR